MSINVDWLGDGWTYYTNEERQAMEAKKQKDAEVRREKAMNQLAVECVAWSCVPIPLRLAVKIFPLVHASGMPDQERADIMNLIAEFEQMIVDANAASQNYLNN